MSSTPRRALVPSALAAVLVGLLVVPAHVQSQEGADARVASEVDEPAVRWLTGGPSSTDRPAATTSDAAGSDRQAPVDPSLFQDLRYRMVGPSRGGRVTTVAGHRSHPHTFYMGSVGGGIWKTTNAGRTWRNVSDGQLATGSMGALQVAESDPDVIYAGTGSDGIRSNVITGRGIYRSTDAGETWTFLGMEEAGQIGAVEVHPRDADVAYVAALGHPFGTNDERGVFRTTDGGNTWEKVLFVSDSVGVIDVEMQPGNPEVLYAGAWRGERKPWTIISGCAHPCGDGIWRSTDGGDTWEQVLTGAEMPEGLIGKIDLAVSPADPDRVYALVEAQPPAEGLYRSDDRGESWRLVNTRYDLMERPFYYTNVDADPTDADVVYVNNEGFFRSADAGESFERIRTPHGDNHDMWINPDDPDLYIQSNDGGANVTFDGGETWSSQQNQPTAELYQVDVDQRIPYWLYAGQQDNTTIAVPSLPATRSAPAGPEAWWEAVGGCETGPAVPHPADPNLVFSNCKGQFGRYSRVDGQEENYWVGAQYIYGHDPARLTYRFQRTVPIEISPVDPDVVYHGSQFVHRTTDGGRTWERISPDLTANPPSQQGRPGEPITNDITGEEYFSTTYVIEASPHREGVVWVGSNDGLVHVTRDGGGSWTDVTPDGLPELARVNAIDPSPHRPGEAYVAAYRFQLDDWAPYIFHTTDHGETWTRIATGENGIPADHAVRVVREDPDREGLLYAGTEFGMFVSFDDGERWQPFQQNLPTTPITDIEVHRKDLVLSTMGRGFWILDDLTPLHQLEIGLADARAHLFAPRNTHRMRYTRPGAYGASAPHWPEFPEPGVRVDYYLGQEAAGAVVLEILDDEGNVIRGYSSADEGYRVEARQEMREPHMVRVGGQARLDAGAGMHRFTWDMSYPGPIVPEEVDRGDDGSSYGGPEDDGPLAAPGSYAARLLVDGDTVATRSFELAIDPRVRADGASVADLEAQLELNLRIRNALSRAYDLAARIVRARERARDAAADVSDQELGSLQRELSELEGELFTEREPASYPRPMLLDQIEYLYGMTTSADQRPGDDAAARIATLENEIDELAGRFEELREGISDRLQEE